MGAGRSGDLFSRGAGMMAEISTNKRKRTPMKRGLTSLLFAVAISAQTPPRNLVVTTDRFTGETSVSLRQFHILNTKDEGSQVQIDLAAIYLSGKIVILAFSSAERVQFSGGADVFALADGERIKLGHFQSGQTVRTGGNYVKVEEIVTGEVGRPVFEKMATAKSLELRIGRWECHVEPADVHKLKEFSTMLSAVRQDAIR
jgi:hypothetical protein